MARYFATVESAAAIPGSSAPTGSTANSLFAVLVGSTTMPLKVRRITCGVRAGIGAPTSQQMTIAIIRTTVRGTATTTNPAKPMDGSNTSTAFGLGLDVAWSTVPTATWTAPYFDEYPFNTQGTLDLPFELLEELTIAPAASNANGLAFFNVGNALPTSHIYAMRVEWEE